MDTNVIVSATDTNNNKTTKTLTDINPNADTTALKTFAQGLNNLTTNNYQGSVRVIKTTLDDETAKLPRNLHLFNISDETTVATIEAEKSYAFKMDGDGEVNIQVIAGTQQSFLTTQLEGDFEDSDGKFYQAFTPSAITGNVSIVAAVGETANYKADTITVTGGNS